MSPHCDFKLENSETIFSRMTLWLMMLHHHTKFGNKMLCDSENIRTVTDILNLRRDLDLERSNPIFFHKPLWLMMLYYQTKFGCKLTSSLEETTEIVIFWLYMPLLWSWYWTQWTYLSAWNSGLWSCITIPGLVTNVLWFRRYHPDKHSLTFWTFAVTLTLNTVIPFSTGHSGLWCCTIKWSLVANRPAV